MMKSGKLVIAKVGWAGFNRGMWDQLGQLFKTQRPVPPKVLATALTVGAREVPLLMVRNARARRYLLRLCPDGTARVTIPRGGTQAEARAFAERHRGWLETQFARLEARPPQTRSWHVGGEIWFRGERVRIEAPMPGQIVFGGETLAVRGVTADYAGDLRPVIERHLRRLATGELPVKVLEQAARHGLTVTRVTVRNQRSRWGSCSRRGTISLNWRLVQTPEWVRDYIILHELAHLREMNHSARFWREVERLCPEYERAERWLKEQRGFFAEG